MSYFKSLILSALVVTAFSCEKYDSKAPVIESVTLNNIVNSSITVASAGGTIDVAYNISDNDDLQSLSVNLYKGWDREPDKIEVEKNLLTYKLSRGLKGSKENGTFDIALPSFTQAGLYTLQIEATDDENNKAVAKFLIAVKNPSSGVSINITDYQPGLDGGKIRVRRSDVIRLNGMVSSGPGSLLKVTGAILNNDALLNSFSVTNFGGDKTFDLGNVNPASTTLDFQIPITAFSGSFFLVLQAQDSENNTGISITQVEVSPI